MTLMWNTKMLFKTGNFLFIRLIIASFKDWRRNNW